MPVRPAPDGLCIRPSDAGGWAFAPAIRIRLRPFPIFPPSTASPCIAVCQMALARADVDGPLLQSSPHGTLTESRATQSPRYSRTSGRRHSRTSVRAPLEPGPGPRGRFDPRGHLGGPVAKRLQRQAGAKHHAEEAAFSLEQQGLRKCRVLERDRESHCAIAQATNASKKSEMITGSHPSHPLSRANAAESCKCPTTLKQHP